MWVALWDCIILDRRSTIHLRDIESFGRYMGDNQRKSVSCFFKGTDMSLEVHTLAEIIRHTTEDTDDRQP